MGTRGKRRCAKCHRFSRYGRESVGELVVTAASSSQVPPGTRIPAGSWICSTHLNSNGTLCGLIAASARIGMEAGDEPGTH